MLHDDLLVNFKADVKFAGWTDTLKTFVCKLHANGKTVIAEHKVNGVKIQIIKEYGLDILFMRGNTIIERHSVISIIKKQNFENAVSDFANVSFGQGREIYRSLMANGINYFRV